MHRLSGRHLAPFVLSFVILITACGGGETTSGFDADPEAIDSDLAGALAADADPEAVPGVQRVFLRWCVKGGSDSFPDLPTVQREGLLAVCGCTYTDLVDQVHATAADELGDQADVSEVSGRAFDLFTEIDEDVRAGGEVPADVLAIARTCIRAEAGL